MDWITNWLQARNTVGVSWWFAWPCVAYTQKWRPWLNARQDEHTVEIEFDQLSQDYRDWLARHNAWLAQDDVSTEDEPTYRP